MVTYQNDSVEKISFYTEASKSIGYGHLYRCIAIAIQFIKEGKEVCFYLGEEEEFILLKKVLPKAYISFRKNIQKEIKINEILFVDIYPKNYQKFKNFIFDKSIKIIGVCDNAYFETYYPFDFIFKIGLQPYSFKKEFTVISNKQCLVYSGNDFFIFRDEFLSLSRIQIKKNANRVFISMGGSDPLDLTNLVLKSLKLINYSLNVKVILGKGYGNDRSLKLQKLHADSKHNILFFTNTGSISEIMKSCDLGVINGGNTRFELALLGVPFISIAMNSKQKKISDEIQKKGIGVSLGVYNEITMENISNNIFSLIENFNQRKAISKEMSLKINSEGIFKIKKLIKYGN